MLSLMLDIQLIQKPLFSIFFIGLEKGADIIEEYDKKSL